MAISASSMAIGALVVSAIGAGVSAYSSYQSGQMAKENAEAQAEAQAALARSQAAAQQAQAAEYERQAKNEEIKAGQAQVQGEYEAERRSRERAMRIGSIYANAAGNGLLVDQPGTFMDILQAENMAAEEDIAITKHNTALNVWALQEGARSQLFAASQARRGAGDSILTANEALRSGYAQGSAAAFQGTTGAIGGSLSALGSLGSAYATGATTFGKKGQTSFWNPTGSTASYYKG